MVDLIFNAGFVVGVCVGALPFAAYFAVKQVL